VVSGPIPLKTATRLPEARALASRIYWLQNRNRSAGGARHQPSHRAGNPYTASPRELRYPHSSHLKEVPIVLVVWIAPGLMSCANQAVQCFRELWANTVRRKARAFASCRFWGGSLNPQSRLNMANNRPLSPQYTYADLKAVRVILAWVCTPGDLGCIDECHHALTLRITGPLIWLGQHKDAEAAA
jgi:hypothetical protein